MIEMVIKVTDVGHLSNGRLQEFVFVFVFVFVFDEGHLSNGRLQDGQSPGPGELTALLTVFLSGEVFLQNLSLSLSLSFICNFFERCCCLQQLRPADLMNLTNILATHRKTCTSDRLASS